jgi:hypothetical protein
MPSSLSETTSTEHIRYRHMILIIKTFYSKETEPDDFKITFNTEVLHRLEKINYPVTAQRSYRKQVALKKEMCTAFKISFTQSDLLEIKDSNELKLCKKFVF